MWLPAPESGAGSYGFEREQMKGAVKILALGAVLAAGTAIAAANQVKIIGTGTPHDAFFGLSFEGQKGLAVGAGGVIAETTDGGATWKRVEQKATQLSLLGVDRRGSYGIAVGQLGTVLVEQSAGQWTAADSGSKSRLLSVSVNSQGTAAAVGEFGTMLKSSDGGKTWTSTAPDWPSLIPTGAEPHIYTVQVGESNQCIAAGEFGLILRSSDGCSTWQPVHPAEEGASSIFALRLGLDDQGKPIGFAVGQSGRILKSVDGGRKWTDETSGTEANLLGVDIAVGGRVVVTGMRAMLVSNNAGASWTPLNEIDIPVAWYQTPRAVGASATVIAVGHSGRIIQVVP